METTTNSEGDLEAVRATFEQWRAGRKVLGGRVPQNLRDAAVRLLDRYSLPEVCGALRIRQDTLRRYRDEAKESLSSSQSCSPDFLQVTNEQLACSNDDPALGRATCTVIIERVDGSRLIVRLPANSCTIESLFAGFIRQ